MKADSTKARIEASKFINLYTFETPEDIRIEDIAMDQGLIIRETVMRGAEARLVQNGENGIITVNIGGDSRRKRFAIAHEIGHWKMHRENKIADLCSVQDLMVTNEDGSIETEANIFAAELLMPRKLFQPLCKDSLPNLDSIDNLSGEFNTSFTSTAIRFVEFNKEKCFLVFSKDGIVQWFWKKSYGSELWIEKGHDIHKRSMAWLCLKDGIPQTNMKVVDPDCWFPNRPSNLQVEVKEQSMKLGGLPFVVSLLVIQEDEKGSFFDM